MRSLILSLLLVISAITSYGQAVETCLAAEGAPEALVTFPHTELITIDPLWINDVEYIPPVSPAGALSVAYWSFSISTPGYFNIDLQTTAGSTITTDVSIGITDGTVSSCPMDASLTESYSGMLMIGTTVSGGCTFLTAGTYTMAFAVNQGSEGDIEVIINTTTGATNEDCAGAGTMVAGANTGNNTCSDGLVWYSYTVLNGGMVSLTPSVSATGMDITTPVITQVIIGDGISAVADCANTPELAGTTSWTCLNVGDVLYFEAGDGTAPIEQGNFTITIVDDPSGITNETCADVTVAPTLAPTCMTTTLTAAGTDSTMGACPDQNSGCPTFETEATVWFAFTTDATAQTVDIEVTNGTISGTEFALIDASAGCPTMGAPATAIGGCQTGGSLINQAITASTTYYIAVSTAAFGTDGTFTLTVTPQNPPANDDCTLGAQDISPTSATPAAGGVNGTTACATGDVLDFCSTFSEDHVVYYTYTVDASITTNRTVTITTAGGGGAITGTDATGLGLGIFADCLGTPATMPSGANLLPVTGTDICDALTGSFVYECVEPGTSFTIAVASEDGLEGDFNIMITEMATGTASNDICDLGTNPDITTVTMGTNFCADGEFNFCGMTTTADHQVWYQYTNTTGANVDLQVTFSGTGTASSATDISMLVLSDACGTTTAFPGTPATGYCNILGTPTTISCIENGETIRILVGSAEDPAVTGPEGDFMISTTEISNSPANDECTGAVDITPPTCIWTTVSSLTPLVSAENACPEDFLTFPAGCDFTTESTVWYSFTVPNDGQTYTLEIQNIANDAFLSIFESTGADCDTYGTPSISSDCETGVGPHGASYDDLTNGATYLIAVGDPTAASGFDFEIRLNLLPSNDECANADALVGGTPTDGTTACATQPVGGEYNSAECTDLDETNTVFYTYEVPAGDKGFHVTITAAAMNGLSGDINLVVFEDDPVGSCATGAGAAIVDEVCTASTTLNEQFECVGEGTYVIRVSTSEANEGDFQITITPIVIVQPNDNCDAPDLTLNPGLDCMWMPATATTIDACPEDAALDPTNCGIDDFPVVWYSVTAPATATFLDLQITGAGSGTPFIAVYDDGTDCSLLNFVGGSTCYTGIFADLNALGQTQITVTGGTTYLIAVGTNDLAGSTIDFEIKWITPPANDECVGAIALVAATPTDGTTACATQPVGGEYNSAACTDADESNTVFYTYEVPATDKGFHVTITGAATNGLMGDINLVVFEDDPGGSCATGAGAAIVDEVCTASTTLNEEFECVGPGTYVIRVSTSGLNEGDFQITITPLTLEQPNDNCDAPDMSLNPGLDCIWQTATANTIGACPEDMALDPAMSCSISTGPTVWYEVTAPANADFLDLQINTDGGSNPFIAVFPGNPVDCDVQTFLAGSNCYEGLFTDLVASGNNLIPVTGGDTYLIAVGVSDPAGVMFEFGIKWITPPDNDECAMAEALTANTATDGTTLCATQPIGGEYNSTECTDADETNTVFYTYEVPATDKGFHVTITAAAVNGFSGDVNLVVFEDDPAGSCATGPGATAVEEVCTISTAVNEEFECVGPGTYVIRVSTSGDNEGDFQITITPLLLEQPNDNCDSPNTTDFTPALECEWMVIDANTMGACPEDMNLDGPNCGLDDFPVTWYEATAPANAEFLDLQINFGGLNPFLAVFEVGPDCDNLTYVAGSTCYSGMFTELNDLGQAQIDITPGTTYLIAVGTNIDAGANINFGIKWITPPDNDECVNAEDFDNLTPSGNPGESSQTLVMETTQCATVALTGSACDPDKTNTVWYTYTVGPDVKEITIDITNYMNTNTDPAATPEFSLAAFDGCGAGGALTFLNQADGSVADYCGGEGVDLLTFSCLEEGDVLTILVSSSSINEGTFDITVNTAEPNCTYTNDECVNAATLTGNPDPLITDDPNDCVLVPGCNDLACTEFTFAACAGIDQLNTVFYTFTTDANVDPVDGAFVNIEILNGQAGELDAPGAVLFSGGCVTAASIGACGAGAGGEYNSGPLGGPGLIQPNTTYTIMIFNSDPNQNGGTFDLCVTVTSGCVNDDICDAFTLEPGITVDNPASSVGCTDDFDVSGCGPAQNEATLWYQVEVPEGATSIEIVLNNQPVDGVTGDVSIAVGPLVDCNALDVTDVLYTDCGGFTTDGGIHTIDCTVEFGTYWIQIGSEDEMEAGDFTITYNFNTNPDPANDLCSTAEDLVVNEFCEFITFPGTLKDACPELFDLGACEYSVNGSVWYTITIPAGPPTVTDMDIEIMGLADPMIGVFEFDCMTAGDPAFNNGVVTSTTNADGTVDCSQMALTEGIVVTPGNTYHILVSSSSKEEIAFDISIKLNAPPINDDPCITSINPPLDLTGGGSHAGTTCCARGPKDTNPDGSVADWENQAPCNNTTEDAAVWYMFTPDPADDGYDVIVNGATISNQMTVQVYATADPASLCNGVPTGDGVIASSCNDLAVEIRFPNCDPTLTYFVKVTTSDDDCGDFDISIMPANVCDYADVCEEAVNPLLTITQESCSDPLEYITVPGCLDLACPDPVQNGCMQMDGPTVWFKINIDDPEATALITQVIAGGFEAVWQVFQGTSCADMTAVTSQEVIDGVTQTFPCSNSDGDVANIYSTPIPPNAFPDGLMYWVSVTALGEVTDPNFEFSYNSALPCLSCSGDTPFDCNNGEFTATVVINGVPTEVEDDFQFCQGIDVNVCLDFNYDTTGSGNDWLHGFVPSFGPGWEIDDNILAGISPGGSFEFFGATGPCAPMLNGYDLPNICTYMEDGILKLCNTACDSGCPCSGGMEDGDPLPSGYWWNTDGGSPSCGTFGCSPASFYGWPSATNVDVQVCFDLKTKVFDSVDECIEDRSLQIIVQTFSDAISGCWDDANPCVVDPSFQGPAWEMECNVPPPVMGEDAEICNNGMVDILLLNGASSVIQVDVIDNPNVLGENSYTFTGGSGSIVDDLSNTSSVTQVVEYIVYTVDPSLPCPGKIDTIEVTIYPDLEVTFPPASVCEGDCTDITPDIIGGAGMPYTYEWGDGQTTASINVCPVVPTTYFVTVTDVLGCMGVGEVEVIVRPPVELLLPESISVCKDDNFNQFNPDYQVCLDFISGSSPFGVQWTTEPGLIGQSGGTTGECFIINEVTSSAFGGINNDGVYTLTATVTDFFGCVGTTDMQVIITGELTIVPMVSNVECGATEADITVTGLDAAGNAVTTFLLYGGCPDNGLGTFIDEFFSNTGTVLFPTVDLLEYTCYVIIGQTESGCQASIEVEIPLTEGTPIDIGGDEAVCIGSDATITVANESDFTTFVWTPDVGTTGSVTFTPDTTATYILEATDASGCVSQALWTVEVNPEPVISLAGALEFCEDGTATITASGGGTNGTYEWTGVAGAQSGASYTTGVPGDATVNVTDENGCVNDSLITFSQVAVIEIILANANICDGMGDTLFVPDNIINVVWEDSTPNTVSDTSFYVISTAGSFTVTGEDATTGCSAAGSFTVEEFITPIINIPDTVEVCRLDSGIDSLCIDFVAIASASANGTWNQDGIIPGFTLSDFPLNDACFTGIQTGCYPFTYTTNTATLPCMDTMATMIVCVKACPCPSPATQGIPDICNLGTYNLENAELTTDPGTWTVQSGPGAQDLTGIITGTIFTATGILPGPYTVRFTLDNPGGGSCDDFSEQVINVVGQEMIDVLAQGQLCNIAGQQFPTTLDLFDLISVDVTNGGTWVQTGTETTIPINGGSMISSATITDFTQTFTFEYTSGNTGGPCPPTVTEVSVNIFDCSCPILIVEMDTLCNDGLPIDLFGLLTNDDGLPGTWSTDGNLVGTSMFDPNGLPSGAYNITYTLDGNPGQGCPTEFSNVVIVRRQAVAEMAQGPEPCTVDTGNGPTTVNLYDWLVPGYTSGTWSQTGGDVITFNDDGNSIAIVDFMTQDIGEQFTYEFTTEGAEEPCVNTTVEIVITVRDCNCPPIGLLDPDPICNDAGMLDLCSLLGNSDPGTFAVFDPFNNDVSNIIDGTGCILDGTDLNANTYMIVYTLDEQVTGICEQTDTVFLDVIEFVDADLLSPPEVCNDINGNGLLVLNFFDYISNADAGTWTDVDGAGVDLSSNVALTSVNFATGNAGGPVPAGTYTFAFVIDNADPCGDVSLELVVTVVDDCNCPPILPSMPDDVCNTAGPVDLTQYDDPSQPGSWSSSVLTVENGNSLVIDGVAAGVYELTYTILTPLPDCPDSVNLNIMVGIPANPGTSIGDLNLCEGESQVINLDDRLDSADLGGVWTETSTTMSTGFSGNTFNSDGQAPGTYTFQYEITNNDPCPDVSSSVTIIIDPNPISDAGVAEELDCINISEDLGGTATSTGSEFVYSWTLAGVEVGTNSTLLDVSVEGVYQLLVTNSNTGCVDSSTVEVTKSDDLPTFMVTETNITCNGDNDGFITISDQSGGDGNYTYSLNGGAAVSDPSSFTGLSAGDNYTIAIFDGIGCSTEQPFVILEPDPVSVAIAADGLVDAILNGEPGDEFVLTIDPVSENIDSVVWSDFNDPTIIFCSGSVAECTSINIAPNLNTTVVYVEVFDGNNCSANDQVQIQLNQIVDVVFPNIITPNGDNSNDFFFIASDDVEQVLSMQIFDRWGELIWERQNFDPRIPSEGWNGKFNDSPVVPGVYVFTVEVLFNDLNSTRETFSGDVTVTDGD